MSQAQLEGNLARVAEAVRQGAKLLCGGQRLPGDDLAHGWFMEPTVLSEVTPAMTIAGGDVFGPVVAVIAVDSFEEALPVANGVDVGLSASIVTRDPKQPGFTPNASIARRHGSYSQRGS